MRVPMTMMRKSECLNMPCAAAVHRHHTHTHDHMHKRTRTHTHKERPKNRSGARPASQIAHSPTSSPTPSAEPEKNKGVALGRAGEGFFFHCADSRRRRARRLRPPDEIRRGTAAREAVRACGAARTACLRARACADLKDVELAVDLARVDLVEHLPAAPVSPPPGRRRRPRTTAPIPSTPPPPRAPGARLEEDKDVEDDRA